MSHSICQSLHVLHCFFSFSLGWLHTERQSSHFIRQTQTTQHSRRDWEGVADKQKEREKGRWGEPGETNAVQPHIWSCPEINNHPWHFVLYNRVSHSQGACWEKQFHRLTDHYFQAKAVILSLSGEKTANQRLTEWTRHLDIIKTHNGFHHNWKWTVGSKWPAACYNISSARPASIYLSNYQSERSSQINRKH